MSSHLDCVEVFIERPKSLDFQAAIWSDYKHHKVSSWYLTLRHYYIF